MFSKLQILTLFVGLASAGLFSHLKHEVDKHITKPAVHGIEHAGHEIDKHVTKPTVKGIEHVGHEIDKHVTQPLGDVLEDEIEHIGDELEHGWKHIEHELDMTKLRAKELEYVQKYWGEDPSIETLVGVAFDLYDKNGNDVIDFGEETERMIHEIKKWGKVSDEDIEYGRKVIDAFFGDKGIDRAKAIAVARMFQKMNDKKDIRKLDILN